MFRSYKQMTIKVKEIVDAIIAEDLDAAAAAFHSHAVKKFQDLLEAEYEDDEDEAGDDLPTDSTDLEDDEDEEDEDDEFGSDEDEDEDEESDEDDEDEDDEDYKPYEDENESDEDEYNFDIDEDDGDLKEAKRVKDGKKFVKDQLATRKIKK